MNTKGYTEQNKEALSQFIRKPLLRSDNRKFGKKQQYSTVYTKTCVSFHTGHEILASLKYFRTRLD